MLSSFNFIVETNIINKNNFIYLINIIIIYLFLKFNINIFKHEFAKAKLFSFAKSLYYQQNQYCSLQNKTLTYQGSVKYAHNTS